MTIHQFHIFFYIVRISKVLCFLFMKKITIRTQHYPPPLPNSCPNPPNLPGGTALLRTTILMVPCFPPLLGPHPILQGHHTFFVTWVAVGQQGGGSTLYHSLPPTTTIVSDFSSCALANTILGEGEEEWTVRVEARVRVWIRVGVPSDPTISKEIHIDATGPPTPSTDEKVVSNKTHLIPKQSSRVFGCRHTQTYSIICATNFGIFFFPSPCQFFCSPPPCTNCTTSHRISRSLGSRTGPLLGHPASGC